MESKLSARIGSVSRKALALPLSFALAAGCAPLPAYAGELAPSFGLMGAAAVTEAKASSTTSEAQSGSVSALYSLYLPVLFRAANGMEEFMDSYSATDSSQWAPSYTLFDIGKDGVPELLVRTNAFGDNNLVHAYTAKSGKLVQLGSYWEWAGKTAGSNNGDLYVAGWTEGKSYVSSVSVVGGQIVNRFLKSGKATDANPGGEIQMVNEYLADKTASWLSWSSVGDYTLLSKDARYSIAQSAMTIGAGGTYDGTAHTPKVTVKFAGATLVSGTDYKLTYKNNKNAGTATATVTGVGNYRGSKSATFTINPASLYKATASVATGGTYSGSAKKPTATVKLGSKTLKKGTDYTVTYKNNVNAGTATAVIAGKGNYKGSKNVSFKIAKANVSSAAFTVASAGAYTGAAKTPSVTAKSGSAVLKAGRDYKATYKNNVEAGSATVVVTGLGNYQGTKSLGFSIAKASVSSAAITVANVGTYTGSPKSPALTVKLGSKVLKLGTDFKAAYSKNVNAGTAAVSIMGMGNYQGSCDASFLIGKAGNPMEVKASDKNLALSKVSKESQVFSPVSFSTKAQGKVTYKNLSAASVSKYISVNASTGVVTVKKGTAKGTYAVKMQVVAAGNDNYATSTKTVSFKVTVK